MALSVRYADVDLVRVYNNDTEHEGEEHAFGPVGPDVKRLLPATSKAISPSSFVDLTLQRRPSHGISDSVATTSSMAGSDMDVEEIELSALRSLARTARPRPLVGTHERFDSTSSSSSSSSSSSHTCSDEWGGVRSEPRPSLDRSLTFFEAQISRSTQRENTNGFSSAQLADDSDSVLEDCASDQSTPPLTPMSPTQTRHGHRLYVPSSSHHDQLSIYSDELRKADLESGSLRISSHKLPVSASLSPVETDTLLAGTSQLSLPLPATAAHPNPIEPIQPMVYHFSFSLLETAVHVLGVTSILLLVIFSMWLTLANVKM